MNNNRIVEIRNTTGSGDPWRSGAQQLVDKTIMSGSNMSLNDLTIPDEVDLILSAEDYSLQVTNNSSTPIRDQYDRAMGNKVIEGATSVGATASSAKSGNNVRFNPWFKDIKTWQGSSISSFQLKFDFSMGQYGLWNAKKEVFAPILGLMSLALPKSQSNITQSGPFLATSSLIANYIQNSAAMFKDYTAGGAYSDILSELSSNLYKAVTSSDSGYYHITIGENFTYQYCSISNAVCSLATTVDDKGFPTRGSVSLFVESVVPAVIDSGTIDYKTKIPYALRFGSFKG